MARAWYKYRVTDVPGLAGQTVETAEDRFIEVDADLGRDAFLAKRRASPTSRAIVRLLKESIARTDRVISVAGGNGEYEVQLVLDGYDILVTDISETALAALAKKFPEVRTRPLDMLAPDFDARYREFVGAFDTAFTPSMFYWFGAGAADLAARNMGRLVRPGGRLLVVHRSRDSALTRFIDTRLLVWEQPLLRLNRRRKTGRQHWTYRSFSGYRRSLEEMSDLISRNAECELREVRFGDYGHEFRRSAVLQKMGLDRPLGHMFGQGAAYVNFLEFVKPDMAASNR
jgi:SAM-dependent methyltransferase